MQAKRQTISWQDFASPQGGFDRSNEALSKSLLFSPPVQEQIQHWPEEREEMQKKLKKAYKEAIPFTWDTTPAIVNARGAFVEEMFLDIWVELLYGGGWTDTEELTFREANWVLVSSEFAFSFIDGPTKTTLRLQVEYKLQGASSARPESEDGRVFLFEEIVPPAYQDQLANPKQKKAGGLFSRSKTTKNAPAKKEAPIRPTRDEAEFDAILRRHTPTKQVTLSKPLNGTIAHVGNGMLAPTAVSGEISPSRSRFLSRPASSSSKTEKNANGARMESNGVHAMKGLFKRKESQEDRAGRQPAAFISSEYDNISTRTMSGPSSGESIVGNEDGRSYAQPKPRRPEAEKWIGETQRLFSCQRVVTDL